MDLEDVAWLDGPDGRAALAAATAYDEDAHARAAAGDPTAVDPLRAATALRRARADLTPARAAAVLTQVRLRRRARPRLGDLTARLLLTEDGLEQATRPVVADLRARRYAAAGAAHLADLGCGLGLDSAAFARAGLRVTAVERDPVVAALAARNVAELGLAHLVTVVVGDATDPKTLGAVLDDVDAAYVDPARRDPSIRHEGRARRVADPESWSPPWSWVERLAARVPRTAAKVAPGVPHELTPEGGCATWTSVDGALVEAELAWPALTEPGVRRAAVVVRSDADAPTVERSAVDLADEDAPPVGVVGSWLLEPDDAVIRAGLVAQVAQRVDGRLLDPRVAYVTTDRDVDVAPLATRFRVATALPYGLTALRAALVAANVGHVVVKKRAIGVDPDDVRRRLALPRAPGSAVVLLTRIGADPWAFVCAVQPGA
ncbi:MAG: class I SAM-dependent methyltransferase [Actinomycetales bacterium]|nr:class I SAM-dependent methyltransferase [Actinomycetales bacterium]